MEVTEKKEPIQTMNLRIPQNMHFQLKAKCKKERRSMNQSILVMIEKYIDDDKKGDIDVDKPA